MSGISRTIDVHRRRTRPPVPVRATVQRPRLLDLLSAGEDDDGPRCDLVTGPAGSGKTTLLSDWVDRRSTETPLAWLTVDPSDNDVHTFRTALVTALANTGDPAVTAAVARVPTSTSDDYRNVGVRLSEVIETGEGLCLVIDDAHVLHDAESLAVLGDLVRWAPAGFRLVIAARFEPPMVLGRARLMNSFNEISERALAFADTEAVALFRGHGVDVTPTELRAVMHWTEGWAAGLQLAAVTAVQSDSARGKLAGFDGTGKAIADYLVGEFLTALEHSTKHMLVTTSIPASVNRELAIRLSGNVDAGNILDDLADAGFLLERTDSEGQVAYRYHPLMRSHLRAEARRLDVQTITRVERESALWCLEVGRPLDALRHAVDSANSDLVIDIVERSGPEIVVGKHLGAVIGLVDRAPAAARDHSTVRLLRASAELGKGNVAFAGAALTIADRDIRPAAGVVTDVLRETLRVQLALCSDPISRPALLTGLDHLAALTDHSDRSDVRACGLLHEAVAEIYLGRLAAAERDVLGARGHAQASRAPATQMQCLGAQAVLFTLQGHLTTGVAAAEQSIKLADEFGLGAHITPQIATMVADHISHLRVEPSTAAPQATWSHLTGSAIPAISEMARALHALQSTRGQAGSLRPSRRVTPNYPPDQDPLAPAMHAMVAAEAQFSLLAAGHHSQAKHYATYLRSRLPGHSEGAVLGAMVDIKLGRKEAARTTLMPALGAMQPAHPVTSVWAWLLQATLAVDANTPGSAFDAVAQAVSAAAPERMVRPFQRLGAPIRSILVHNQGRFGENETFVDQLRTMIEADPESNTINLSPREYDVLRELPSWRSAEVIAADLFISVNTAKTHLRGIYRKLGVTNRRDAVTAAQDRGLI